MPPRGKGKKQKQTRAYIKRYPRKSATGMAGVGKGSMMNFPLQTKLPSTTRYCERLLNLDVGLGGLAVSYVFSMNGLYDCNITGGGHSALGFDQLSLMYDHYCVTEATAHVTFSNLDKENPQTVILQIKDTNGLTSDVNTIMENGRCKTLVLEPLGAGGASKTLSIKCNLSTFFGRPVQYDDIFRGSLNSNPGDQAFLHVTAVPVAQVDADQIKFSVRITYKTIWTEPKLLASS